MQEQDRGHADGVPTERPRDPGPVDPRAAARASLAAGRSASLWWVCAGLAVVLGVTVAAGPRPGGLLLAGLLAGFAVARAVLRAGPVALTVRSRTVDTAVLAALALAVGVLAQVIPTP
ncbi:DUF3017 domain-containing protein [uncultured Cellulomonas sp.]|uniref:DUF3017 domain-containing protein n=1 Tax=uncultured Cellulomonas sp. TaxID=189682 RepID=UPI0026247559|nr:DUF3017 domain-containing protein [uncultured Cellulomonas sp.]